MIVKRLRIPLFRLLLTFTLLVLATGMPGPAAAAASTGAGSFPGALANSPALQVLPDATGSLTFTGIATGYIHSCGVTTLGGVMCWGANDFGLLGDGTSTSHPYPAAVTNLSSGVASVQVGYFHSCVLTTTGGVKCWGRNDHGQLGDNSTTDRPEPVDVNGLTSGVAAIAVGFYHTCVLLTGRGMKCWGENAYGQLGDGTHFERHAPVTVNGLGGTVTAIAAGGFHTCALPSAGGVKCWGGNSSGQLGDNTTNDSATPVNVAGLGGSAMAIAAGEYHTCAQILKDTNFGMRCWGDNTHGQLGNGVTDESHFPVDVTGLSSGVSVIAPGYDHTCAVVAGAAKCWGNNAFGQLGDGSTTDRTTPVAVIGLSSGVTAIASGQTSTCAVGSGGAAKCWGSNAYGQLGIGSTDRSVPLSVTALGNGVTGLAAGMWHACAIIGGGAECWGWNENGALGDNTTINRSAPTAVSGLSSGVTVITAGVDQSCALAGGTVKCWGGNWNGQSGGGMMGIGNLTPVTVTGLTNVTSLAAGWYHTCALLSGGSVKCWGRNGNGELGNGGGSDSMAPVAVSGLGGVVVTAIAANGYHTCALTSTGGVKCWGMNGNGELGDSSTTDRSAPVTVAGLAANATAIAAGFDFSCALLVGGKVQCWGANESGQLGDGSTDDSLSPVTSIASGASAITAGFSNTCALVSGAAKCWGGNDVGQVGDGTRTDQTSPAAVTGLGSGVTAIAAGGAFFCALVTGGSLLCWGEDSDGQLGIGSILFNTSPMDVILGQPPSLRLNYATGKAGSIFTLTGWNYPAGSQVSLAINNQVMTHSLAVNPSGSFLVFLDTGCAVDGNYTVTVSSPTANASFALAGDAALHLQEGGGQTFSVCGGTPDLHHLYLPILRR